MPTHNLGACWILRQVAKSGEDLLINDTAENHPVENNDIVLIVVETFASNNRCKRALRSLAEICHVAAINPWNDTAITFNVSNEPQFQHQPLWSLVQLWMASGLLKCSWTVEVD